LDFKNIIINNKNKLLFGYITAEKVLQNFELIKEDLDFALQELNYYLDDYNNIINIDINKQILDFDKIELNQLIQQLKKAIEINDFDESINIYITKLKPLLNKILNLKYKINKIEFNEFTNTYHLIQQKYNLENLETIPI
jgi:chemotaxis protein CheY-P-specific phosphatase CheC